MKRNRLNVIIEKPVEEVFEFTTNPKNTPSWICTYRKKYLANILRRLELNIRIEVILKNGIHTK